MKNKEKAQQAYFELQMFERRIQQLQQQIQLLQQQAADLELVQNNLSETKKTDKGASILVPLANGIFARAKIEDSKDLLVNVGAGTLVIKNVEDTNKMLGEQVLEAKRVEAKLMRELEQLANQFNQKQEELQKLVK